MAVAHFSRKDFHQGRSLAAYHGTYIAKNIVAAGIADRAEVQLAYAIAC